MVKKRSLVCWKLPLVLHVAIILNRGGETKYIQPVAVKLAITNNT